MRVKTKSGQDIELYDGLNFKYQFEGRDYDGEVTYSDGMYYMLQWHVDGNYPNNKKGYTFSWVIEDITDFIHLEQQIGYIKFTNSTDDKITYAYYQGENGGSKIVDSGITVNNLQQKIDIGIDGTGVDDKLIPARPNQFDIMTYDGIYLGDSIKLQYPKNPYILS